MVARTSIHLVLSLGLLACSGAPAPPPSAPPPTLEAHARAQDDEGLRAAIAALKTGSGAQRMEALAALLEYDPSKLQSFANVLEDRAAHAPSDAEKSAAAWVLVRMGDARVVPAALALYGSGALERVKKLGGGPAFDPVELARLVAAVPAPESLATFRRKALLTALPSADTKLRPVLVRALLDADDGVTLVSVATMLDPQKDFGVLEQVFRRLMALSDPRAADALASYADHATHPHFRTLAALVLAGVGDLRAAPHLAWRIGQDPRELYDRNDPNAVRLASDDSERVTCARRLSDLAQIHPEAHTQLREIVEAPTLAWAEHYQHDAALRALVDVESPKVLPLLRKLADPGTPIPTLGANPPVPDEFLRAQTALRLLGRAHDGASMPLLEKQLGRKPASFDASMESTVNGRSAVAALVYRALAVGAIDGFMDDDHAKALPLLVKTAEDPTENEQTRLEACKAVVWIGDATVQRDVVAKIGKLAPGHKKELAAVCWLTGLGERPMPSVDRALLGTLTSKTAPAVRHQAARVLGQGGIAPGDRAALEALLADPVLVHDAAVALLLGGDAGSVAKALGAYEPKEGEDATAPPTEPLRQLYAQSIGVLGEELVSSGALARMASLALAARNVTVRGVKQDWVLQGLAYQLRELGQVDAGPHTMTRTRLLAKLMADAKGTDAAKRNDALLLLWVLGERASLAALGDTAHLAEPSP